MPTYDARAGTRVVYLASISAFAAVCLLCVNVRHETSPGELAQLREQQARWGSVWAAANTPRQQMLWGGDGLVTTGDYVDGRPTVRGLHTDCLPGVLRSDCSPAQEDGAWSKEAAEYIDDHTAGAHSNTMNQLQANVNRAFKAKDDYLAACLKDWRNCNKPAAEVTGYDDRMDDQNDAATYGIHQRFSAKPSLKYSGVAPPDQYSEYSPMMDDGPWNQVNRPSGHHADKSGLVSGAYWDTTEKPGHIF